MARSPPSGACPRTIAKRSTTRSPSADGSFWRRRNRLGTSSRPLCKPYWHAEGETMASFWLKLKRRRRMQQDLDDELAFHKRMAEEHGNSLPLGPRGNETLIREEAYDQLRFVFLENLWRDIVYAARGLRRNPALVFTALLSLALGIGANTTMFSLGMEFLFSEPSMRNPSSVVSVVLAGNSHASAKVVDFVRDSGLFADVAGENEEVFVNWNDGTR